jgi:5-methylcytosine-specific restriction endonuclease McrA
MSPDVVADAPRVGKTFHAQIHRIDDSSNGIIETKGGHINVGPVWASAVGEYVEALKLPGRFARVNTKKIIPPDYIERFKNQFHFDIPIDYGDAGAELHKREHTSDPKYRIVDAEIEPVPYCERETQTVEVDRISGSGNGIIEDIAGRRMRAANINIGPVTEDSHGDEVEIVRLTRDHALCLTAAARSENYFVNHPADIDRSLVDSRTQFDVGMTVHDRTEKNSEDAIVVNIPRIAAEDFIAYYDGEKEVSVAEDNPEYDPTADVVVVVYQDDLEEYRPSYDGEAPLPLKELNNHNIPHFAFPPGRLTPANHAASPVGSNPDAASTDQVEVIDKERIIKASVEGISSGGDNRLVQHGNQRINIGPVSVDPGQQVTIIRIDDDHPTESAHFGCALLMVQDLGEADRISLEDYLEELAELAHISVPELMNQIQSTVKIENAETLASKAIKEDDSTEKDTESVEEDPSPTATESKVPESPEESEALVEPGEPEESEEPGKAGVSNSSVGTSTASKELASLREQAEQEAQTNIDPEQTPSRTTETTEYTRSEAVKNYAKARADGACEHCGDPAPFSNPDGDPYLHAHHVHELSDGGADTPETVIAVCPNCHYHAHHGQDKKEFNQHLMEDLADIEDVPLEDVKNPDS